jgi:capsular polysaccharide biosynthesis protein
MELIRYFRILTRWWWLLAIVASIAGGGAYVWGRTEDPLYRAEVKVFVGSYLQNPDPRSDEIYTGQNLALTYAKLATVRPILEATIEALELEMDPGELAEEITTTPDTD